MVSIREFRYQQAMILAIGIFAIASIIVLSVLLDRSTHELDALEKRIDAACRSRLYDLSGAIRRPRPGEFRTVVQGHVLDSGVLRLCLGSEYPVPLDDADACWIKTSRDDCYTVPAEQLLGLYRRKFAEPEH